MRRDLQLQRRRAAARAAQHVAAAWRKQLSLRGLHRRRPRRSAAASSSEAVTGWLRSGELVVRETVREGLEEAVPAFLDLLRGGNTGKMIVRLGPTRRDLRLAGLIAGRRGQKPTMWLFFTRRLRMWLILTVARPARHRPAPPRRPGARVALRPVPRQPGAARAGDLGDRVRGRRGGRSRAA